MDCQEYDPCRSERIINNINKYNKYNKYRKNIRDIRDSNIGWDYTELFEKMAEKLLSFSVKVTYGNLR